MTSPRATLSTELNVTALIVLMPGISVVVALIITTYRWLHPPTPDITLGHPGAHISLTPLHELGPDETRRLVAVEPTYLIENKWDANVYGVTTGVRTRDGSDEHPFETFLAQILRAGETAPVAKVGTIPEHMIRDLHESSPQDEFLYWTRYRDRRGNEWETVYDPATLNVATSLLRLRWPWQPRT